MKIFGFDSEMTEEQIANELLKRYKKMMTSIEKKKTKGSIDYPQPEEYWPEKFGDKVYT